MAARAEVAPTSSRRAGDVYFPSVHRAPVEDRVRVELGATVVHVELVRRYGEALRPRAHIFVVEIAAAPPEPGPVDLEASPHLGLAAHRVMPEIEQRWETLAQGRVVVEQPDIGGRRP